MRNFWIDTKIDGRKTKLAGGPKSRTGEMSTVLYVRKDGRSEVAYKSVCKEDNGILIVRIYDKNDVLIYEQKNPR